MNVTETTAVMRHIAAACPQQRFDEHTPEVWAMVLEPYRLKDCLAAVIDLAREHTWIGTAEIATWVRELHSRRLLATPMPSEPDWIGQDTALFLAWTKATRAAIIHGDPLPDETAIRAAIPRQSRTAICGPEIPGGHPSTGTPGKPATDGAANLSGGSL